MSKKRLIGGSQSLNSPSTALNNILSERIGYGKAQHMLTMSLNILLFSEGAESMVLGLLLPELTLEWEIGVFEKSALIASVYLGVSIGSYVETFSDKYGRYPFITINAALQCAFGLLSLIATSIEMLIVFRFFYGVGIGIALPLSGTYMSEITPSDQRTWVIAKAWIYWSLGCLTTCFLGWILLRNHHWRWLLFLICVPGIYALYHHYSHGWESLRFLWLQGKSDQCYQLLKLMAELNGREVIPREELESLISADGLSGGEPQTQGAQKVDFRSLFNDKYAKMTVYLMITWFSMCFIFYAVLLLLPTILSENASSSYDFGYFFLMVVSLTEILCYIYCTKIIDHRSIGRKKVNYISMFIIAMMGAILIVVDQSQTSVLLFCFVILKIFATSVGTALYPYTAEIYDTTVRGKAMGLMSFVGRVATTILGLSGVSALYWLGGNGLYFLFVILGLLSGACMYKMPYCTLGKELDT